MIDHAKLPNKVLLDTNTLIRAWGDRPEDLRSPACIELWDSLVAKKREIYIAAPSLAEIMRFKSATKIPVTTGVRIVNFDRIAAELCAQHFPYVEMQNAAHASGAAVTYYKYDALIASCALRAKVEVLVAMDDTLSKRATAAGLMVQHPSYFQAGVTPVTKAVTTKAASATAVES